MEEGKRKKEEGMDGWMNERNFIFGQISFAVISLRLLSTSLT